MTRRRSFAELSKHLRSIIEAADEVTAGTAGSGNPQVREVYAQSAARSVLALAILDYVDRGDAMMIRIFYRQEDRP